MKMGVVVEVKGTRTCVVRVQVSNRLVHVHADHIVPSQVRKEGTGHKAPELQDMEPATSAGTAIPQTAPDTGTAIPQTAPEDAVIPPPGVITLPPAIDAPSDSEVPVLAPQPLLQQELFHY